MNTACPDISLPRSHVSDFNNDSGTGFIAADSALFIDSAPYPLNAGPFLTGAAAPQPCSRGKWTRTAYRVDRSTTVPIAERAVPMMRSPSQWPGTDRSSASGGRLLSNVCALTCAQATRLDRARGIRNDRPVRKHKINSRSSAPRPSIYNAW